MQTALQLSLLLGVTFFISISNYASGRIENLSTTNRTIIISPMVTINISRLMTPDAVIQPKMHRFQLYHAGSRRTATTWFNLKTSGHITMHQTIGSKKPRARDLGIPFDGIPGKYNAITDVYGVQVGFRTLIEGDSIRTGITAIFPRGANRPAHEQHCFANWFSLNGNGEMTGIHFLTNSGMLSTPILITTTNSVGICYDSLIKWALQQNYISQANIGDIGLPVVAETWDGILNDYRGFPLKEEHVFDALNNAKESGPNVQEGNVGGGTGMITFGYKGGTGTSSRMVVDLNYTVGVLVQANFGRKKQLIIAGVPVGQELLDIEANSSVVPDKDTGSIIVILATDAPLLPHQLKRMATRISLGIGKLGGIGADSSGDIFLAFSTANITNKNSTTKVAEFLSNDLINPLFDAAIQCVEEAIVNALIAAETMVGFGGIRVESISHDNIIKILRKYNRLNDIKN